MEVALSIAPVFALIASGTLAVRLGYVPAASMRPIGDFVLRVALPALIFRAVGTVPLSQALNAPFLGAYLAGSLGAFGLGWLVMRRGFGVAPAAASILALGMSLSNSGFVGYPVVLSVMGPVAATLLAQCMLVENVVMIPMALALAERREGGWRAALPSVARGTARNPIVVSVLAGLAFSASGLPLPEVAAVPLGLMADVAAPVALFAIGGTVASLPLAGVYRRVGAIVAGKLVVHPLLVLAALSVAPGVDETARAGGTLYAAVSMLSIFPLLSARVGLELVAATSLLAAVVLSFGTLSLAIALLT